MSSAARNPLPRFPERPKEEEQGGGFRLVSENEVKREREYWHQTVMVQVNEFQMMAMKRVEELIESRTQEVVQGDSGGSKEQAMLLSSRLSLVERRIAAEEVKTASQAVAFEKELEQMRTAIQMMATELADERKGRAALPAGGSVPSGTTSKNPQLLGEFAAQMQSITGEVKKELRNEFSQEMSRKYAMMQARCTALEAGLGGEMQRIVGEMGARVNHVEQAQVDTAIVKQRVVDLENSLNRSFRGAAMAEAVNKGQQRVPPGVKDAARVSLEVEQGMIEGVPAEGPADYPAISPMLRMKLEGLVDAVHEAKFNLGNPSDPQPPQMTLSGSARAPLGRAADGGKGGSASVPRASSVKASQGTPGVPQVQLPRYGPKGGKGPDSPTGSHRSVQSAGFSRSARSPVPSPQHATSQTPVSPAMWQGAGSAAAANTGYRRLG